MWYNAVLKYVYETQGKFYSYHLPTGLLPGPEDETVTCHIGSTSTRPFTLVFPPQVKHLAQLYFIVVQPP